MLCSVIFAHDYMFSLYGVLTNFTETQKTHQERYFYVAVSIPFIILVTIMACIAKNFAP
jgi:hypothetical protein